MPSRESLPPLSAAQMEIMGVVWEYGEMTLTQICAYLAPGRALARTTVQTQLSRLVDKGWLTYRAEGKTFFYCTNVPREAAQNDVARRLVETVFRGSTVGLMMSLLKGRRLSKEEADRIRALIEKAEEEQL